MDNVYALADIKVDYQWFEHYGVDLLAGRYFRENERRIETPDEDNPVTSGAAILNESAARRFGWTPAQAVGQILRQPENRELSQFIDREIVGVVQDIHFSSLHDEIKGTVYAEPNPRYDRHLSVKLAAGNHESAIEHFEAAWLKFYPEEPSQWQFLDDRFDALYRSEARQAQMFGVFAVLAVLVATLGLFGLASFTTERRTKEIGIRKVMGARVTDILLLLTGDFTRLVLLANVIAWPLAYFGMQQWLSRFAYQAPLSTWWWLFLAAGLLALVVAWVTIAAQATRAATRRPVLALRYE
jgi:putative ABC transport system permease protein